MEEICKKKEERKILRTTLSRRKLYKILASSVARGADREKKEKNIKLETYWIKLRLKFGALENKFHELVEVVVGAIKY